MNDVEYILNYLHISKEGLNEDWVIHPIWCYLNPTVGIPYHRHLLCFLHKPLSFLHRVKGYLLEHL